MYDTSSPVQAPSGSRAGVPADWGRGTSVHPDVTLAERVNGAPGRIADAGTPPA